MPAAQLFFGNNQQSGNQQLAGASPLAFNVVTDGAGAVRRRPGLATWSGFPEEIPVAEPIAGMNSFGDDLYYVTETQRRIYRVSGGVATNLSTGGADTFLAGTGRPVFAETQFRLVIAGGAAPSKVQAGAAALLGGSPPNSRYVTALASRLFTDDLTSASTRGRIRNSGLGSTGNETWNALGFVSAEARPDDLVAIKDNANELFAFGETTLQVFTPDPQTVMAPQRAINRGCSAGHSVVRVDESFAWLDEQKQFVISDGRSMEVLSDPIAETLDGISAVDDCVGLRANIGQYDLLAWHFPSDGRTFCQQRGGGWGQWSGWADALGHTTIPIRSHYYWPAQNLHLVGLESGQIVQLDPAAASDFGGRIKADVTTGFMNHGTDAMKFTDELRLTFKRGSATTTEPFVMLSWRDRLGAFGPPRRIGLGVTGDYVFTKRLHSLGGYRARQWRMEFDAAQDFVLARVEETFSVEGDD